MLTYKGCNYLRQRIILSLLSGKPVKITDIRSEQEEPGLREYEVNLLRLVDKLSNGLTLDVNETGTELYLKPGVLIGGVVTHECCKQRSIGYYLEVILALTPYLKKGIEITLRGVTNDQVDPSVDSFKYAALPLLRRFLLVDFDLELSIKKRGSQPNGGGEIFYKCNAIKNLKPVQLIEMGKIKRIRGTVFSLRVSPAISNRIVEKSKGVFLRYLPDVFLSVDHLNGQRAGKSPGFGACLVAETTTGVFLTSDVMSTPTPGVRTIPEDVGEMAAFNLLEEIFRGGCVDSTFQSLACLYMALRSNDVSRCLFGPLSPYTVQFLKHLKDFFGIMFKLEAYRDPEAEDEGLKSTLNKVLVTCVGAGYNKLV